MKTFTGGCHCQKVRFEVDLELEHAIACNCSICSKRGWLLTFAPASAFRLITSEENLTKYQFNTKKIEHLFCNTCGTASFGRGTDQDGNGTVAINVRCLDDVDLESLQIIPYDGKNA